MCNPIGTLGAVSIEDEVPCDVSEIELQRRYGRGSTEEVRLVVK
jgi:hypothetical protein